MPVTTKLLQKSYKLFHAQRLAADIAAYVAAPCIDTKAQAACNLDIDVKDLCTTAARLKSIVKYPFAILT
jgi:hypothetical protein